MAAPNNLNKIKSIIIELERERADNGDLVGPIRAPLATALSRMSSVSHRFPVATRMQFSVERFMRFAVQKSSRDWPIATHSFLVIKLMNHY